MTWSVVEGDCREVMAGMEPWSVDAIVTDPPYGLEFMGKEWDRLGADVHPVGDTPTWTNGSGVAVEGGPTPFGGGGQRVRYGSSVVSAQAWHREWAAAALRVLKPGGHLLAFGGTRTFHRLACALEDAGFEIRDCLSWLYGQGFPKSRNLGGGWGTALKPGWEPVVLARAPLARSSVTANHAAFGTGGINVDGSRLDFASDADEAEVKAKNQHEGYANPGSNRDSYSGDYPPRQNYDAPGRWPPNVAIDADAVAMLDAQVGERAAGRRPERRLSGSTFDHSEPIDYGVPIDYGSGAVSRFFYCPKADRAERDVGMDGAEERPLLWSSGTQSPGTFQAEGTNRMVRNDHPTVKPIALMRWLCRLVTPGGGSGA